jgi:hypothetical protein
MWYSGLTDEENIKIRAEREISKKLEFFPTPPLISR